MNDVRMPIETNREGDKITKVCVEDVYKIINRCYKAMDKAYNNADEILESIKKDYYPSNDKDNYYNGYLIVGTGISQPCMNDTFNEETGNNIAFMKAKLNANIKKHNFLYRIFNEYWEVMAVLLKDINNADYNIRRDLSGIREYNKDYLSDIEEKLGIEYEI